MKESEVHLTKKLVLLFRDIFWHIDGQQPSMLKCVDPVNYEYRRQNKIDRTNPVPYQALYFGHKLHIDQNEKLISFGVTSVVARDGYSGRIILFGIMPIKNNLAIYDLVFR